LHPSPSPVFVATADEEVLDGSEGARLVVVGLLAEVAGGLGLVVGRRTEDVDTGLDVLDLEVLVLIAFVVLVLVLPLVLAGRARVVVRRLLGRTGPPGGLESPFPSPYCIGVVLKLPSQYSTHPPNLMFFITVLNPVIPAGLQSALRLVVEIEPSAELGYSTWKTSLPAAIKLLYKSHPSN
jgi:hypothetical protein